MAQKGRHPSITHLGDGGWGGPTKQLSLIPAPTFQIEAQVPEILAPKLFGRLCRGLEDSTLPPSILTPIMSNGSSKMPSIMSCHKRLSKLSLPALVCPFSFIPSLLITFPGSHE